jgi:Ni/Fe-hydrogenase subunit HybB-like protein
MYTELKDFGYLIMWGVVIMSLLTFVGYVIYEWIYDRGFQAGYWCGRSAGWKASLEHNRKLERMKSRAVFDYDKH